MRAGLLLLAASSPALDAAAPAQLRFIACPIYRDADAGKKSGCWLVDNRQDGLRYDVSQSPTKPDWNFAVLVEGVASAKAGGEVTPCGGVVMEPVRVSLLNTRCPRQMLPAEGYTGRKFILPRRNLQPLFEARPAPAKPYATRVFVVPFSYNSAFITYQLGDYYIDQAATYAATIKASRVEITGYAATLPATVSGQTVAEPMAIAKDRAKIAAEWIERTGTPAARVKLTWLGAAKPADFEAADGLTEPSRRRVEIRVIP